MWVCLGYSPLTFFLPLVTFLVVLYLFKIVSLSSMLSSVGAVVYLWLSGAPVPLVVAAGIFALLILLRHHGNIKRMLEGCERKISWM